MKKLIVLVVLLAVAPLLVPAKADALTLRQRVTRLEGKLNCLRRVPVIQ
jgi:cell division protein FtsL